MNTTVALQKCEEYDFDAVYATITKMMELVPPPDVAGKTVLLKPNILAPKKPEAAVCTHPVVVGAAVKAFVARGAKRVIVGESPATANPTSAAKATGMYDQVLDNGGEWVEFCGGTRVDIPDGQIIKTIEFADAFAQADVVVSLSKLKTHQFMSYTGAMKNLFGFIVGLKKSQQHYRFQKKEDFARYLTDLNLAANAQYAIMDAITGMEGMGGPGNGDPVHLGFMAASDNILAVDWVCASAVGYNPHQISNLEDALQRGRWLTNPDDITCVGETLDAVRCPTFKLVKDSSASVTLQKMLPNWLNSLATLVFVKTPRFDSKKCITCGRCIEICPPHILRFEQYADGTTATDTPQGRVDNKNPQKGTHVTMLDRSKCLHCFCCHEICPVEAITLHRF